jgi:hypothetical protein
MACCALQSVCTSGGRDNDAKLDRFVLRRDRVGLRGGKGSGIAVQWVDIVHRQSLRSNDCGGGEWRCRGVRGEGEGAQLSGKALKPPIKGGRACYL